MYSAIDRILKFPSQENLEKIDFDKNPTETPNKKHNDSHIPGEYETHLLYEKSIWVFKTHRNIADSDVAAIHKIAAMNKKLTNEIGEKNKKIVNKVVEQMFCL